MLLKTARSRHSRQLVKETLTGILEYQTYEKGTRFNIFLTLVILKVMFNNFIASE